MEFFLGDCFLLAHPVVTYKSQTAQSAHIYIVYASPNVVADRTQKSGHIYDKNARICCWCSWWLTFDCQRDDVCDSAADRVRRAALIASGVFRLDVADHQLLTKLISWDRRSFAERQTDSSPGNCRCRSTTKAAVIRHSLFHSTLKTTFPA